MNMNQLNHAQIARGVKKCQNMLRAVIRLLTPAHFHTPADRNMSSNIITYKFFSALLALVGKLYFWDTLSLILFPAPFDRLAVPRWTGSEPLSADICGGQQVSKTFCKWKFKEWTLERTAVQYVWLSHVIFCLLWSHNSTQDSIMSCDNFKIFSYEHGI